MVYNFLVYVRCITFNHAHYIKDAMNGFTMQQTTFPFVCVIIDDASTDDEPGIIKEYLNENFNLGDSNLVRREETDDYVMIFAQHKSNKNCFFAVYFLKYNHYSIKRSKNIYFKEWHDHAKYIAYCEGDDYWVNAEKLQKQYNSLENNPKAVMAYTGFRTVDENGNDFVRPFYQKCMEKSHSGDCLATLYDGSYIMTLTKFINKDVIESEKYQKCPVKYDYSLDLSSAIMGDFIYLPDIMGCYRYTPTGAMATQRELYRQYFEDTYKYFSRIVLDGQIKNIKPQSKLIIRLHILVHSMKNKDWMFVVEIMKKDFISILLFPIAFIYSLLKLQ